MSAPRVSTKANGWTEVLFEGAVLVLRPDFSHSWSNVKEDSELYRAMLDAAIAARGCSMRRYTPPFPGGVRPVRPGVYQRNIYDDIVDAMHDQRWLDAEALTEFYTTLACERDSLRARLNELQRQPSTLERTIP